MAIITVFGRMVRLGSKVVIVPSVLCVVVPGADFQATTSALRAAAGTPPAAGTATLASASLRRLHLKSLFLCLLWRVSPVSQGFGG